MKIFNVKKYIIGINIIIIKLNISININFFINKYIKVTYIFLNGIIQFFFSLINAICYFFTRKYGSIIIQKGTIRIVGIKILMNNGYVFYFI